MGLYPYVKRCLVVGTNIKENIFANKRTCSIAEIQAIISRALDDNNFYVLASLDLSAAFDLVNRELLFKRMETMGIPDDIIYLLKNWAIDRKFYVDIMTNKRNSQI